MTPCGLELIGRAQINMHLRCIFRWGDECGDSVEAYSAASQSRVTRSRAHELSASPLGFHSCTGDSGFAAPVRSPGTSGDLHLAGRQVGGGAPVLPHPWALRRVHVGLDPAVAAARGQDVAVQGDGSEEDAGSRPSGPGSRPAGSRRYAEAWKKFSDGSRRTDAPLMPLAGRTSTPRALLPCAVEVAPAPTGPRRGCRGPRSARRTAASPDLLEPLPQLSEWVHAGCPAVVAAVERVQTA